jgi:chemotaxis protein CheZ
MVETTDQNDLKRELSGLFQYIQRVRQEIAAMRRPSDSDFEFDRMADQLDAIVEATEEATNTIMATVEKNEEIMAQLREKVSDPDVAGLIDDVSANNMNIFEACSFQDLTGQRVTKVFKSLTYVEDRVNALVEIWGRDELEKIEVTPTVDKTDDEKLLNGPQRANEAISQDEIDALFD